MISEVLEPLIFSSYGWLESADGFTILTEAFRMTGLKDTMGIYRYSTTNQPTHNRYTLLVEHDTIFARYGIHSFDDLVDEVATPGMEFSDPENGLYQFTAYHILEGSYFLDDFDLRPQNYNTYGNNPVQIDAGGSEIKINPGVDTFGYEISGLDTTYIDYISFHYQHSNILTKNGAIHLITELMSLYRPSQSDTYFEFRGEADINTAFKLENIEVEFTQDDDFEILTWTGPDILEYVRNVQSEGERARYKDYIRIEGNFTIDYIIPRIWPGEYEMSIRANADNTDNAIIQVFLDGVRMGGNLELSAGVPELSKKPYEEFRVGVVEFNEYKEHVVSIKSLIPGIFIWDYVRFIPESKNY